MVIDYGRYFSTLKFAKESIRLTSHESGDSAFPQTYCGRLIESV